MFGCMFSGAPVLRWYLRLSEPVTTPVEVVVVVETALVLVVDVLVVVEPVFIVGMTAADSFSFSLSALSSDQYLFYTRVFRTRPAAPDRSILLLRDDPCHPRDSRPT